MPLLEEVAFFIVWFDPDLPVLRIHLKNTGLTARLTARRYRALNNKFFLLIIHCDPVGTKSKKYLLYNVGYYIIACDSIGAGASVDI